MALKLAGEEIGIQEKIETIIYQPGVKDSGDLEAGTHTITPTSRPAIGSAQYSKSLTLPKPGDARLAVKRIVARLNVNIAGLGTATHVYCSVRVDVDDADHELFSEDWTSTGSKLDTVDVHSANKSTIYNLLKDGAAHTFYFLFWADAADQATIDVVQLWEGVGSSVTNGALGLSLELEHKGFVGGLFRSLQQGTGISYFRWCFANDYELSVKTGSGNIELPLELMPKSYFFIYGTVATDINCVYTCGFILRSAL